MRAIYNAGIAERVATFETRPRTDADVAAWLDHQSGADTNVCVVAEDGGDVVAFARTFPYSARACYAHIAELSIYVTAHARRRGVGRALTEALTERAARRGIRKLVGRVFADNRPSRDLFTRLGFREVGVHERHGQLDGQWLDIVIVERHLP